MWCIGEGSWPEGIPDHILATFPTGINVHINLETLIENVIISPTATSWFFGTVADLTKVYGYGFSVTQSSLTTKPYL